MERKLHYWIVALMLWCSVPTVQATDYLYLNVTGTGGSYQLSDIRKITFTASDMVLWSDNGTTTIPLADIGKMILSDMSTGIETPQARPAEAFTIANGKLQMADGALLTIYSTDGRMVRQLRANGQEQIDLSTLPKGAYIIKVNNTARKIVN